MQIVKVLNNSLLLALDDNGNERILMGKGIGYNQAIGNRIEPSLVEKTFLLQDKKAMRNFIQLANELDEDYFHLVKQIIEFAQTEYQIEVMDYLYLSLSDHIDFALQRAKSGITGENFAYFDLIKRHSAEYAVGQYALNLIQQRFGITLPEAEAATIGLHFLNAKINSNQLQKEQAIFELVKNIETIVQRMLAKPLNKENFSYSRFITHITYFSERIIEHKFSEALTEKEANSLYLSMQNELTQEVQILEKITDFIQKKFKISISQQEKIYLLVHLNRLCLEH